jgi:hypothetical protein
MRSVALAALALTVQGCGAAGRVSRANDELRLERETLSERVASLEGENAELRAKLAEAGRQTPPGLLDAAPRVASVTVSRLSLLEEQPPSAVVFIAAADGRGRFVQALATLSVRVVDPGADGSQPTLLGGLTIEPAALRDALVSGLAGQGYRVHVPLGAMPAQSALVTVELRDELTGLTHRAERVLRR